jgi:thiol-disulfide isomerase/thioredoxin
MLILAALALAGCGSAASGGASTAHPVGKPVVASESKLLDDSGLLTLLKAGDAAPDFQYTLGDGVSHKLSDLRGKKVLVNFWATWCGPCRVEMPDLQKATQAYGDSFAVLGVNWREQPNVIGPFAEELGISCPLIANPSEDITRRYGVRNAPLSYFLNSDGTIAFRQIGVMNYDFIKLHIDQLK